jgi:hypothetical protein
MRGPVVSGRRRLTVVILALAIAVGGTAVVRAQGIGAKESLHPTVFFSFCQEAQKTVAGITGLDGVTITGTAYADLGDSAALVERTFVKSKSTIVQPLIENGELVRAGRIETRQYVQWTAPGSGKPKNILCKMRTAESLVRTDPLWGFGNRVTVSGANPAGGCRRVNEDTLASVQDELAADGVTPVYAPGDIAFEDDLTYTTGAGWAYGDHTVLTSSGGELNIRSGSVYSPVVENSGLPLNFMAAHYCTFVAPSYLSDVLRGTVTLP